MKIPFFKYQGTGNDFVMVNQLDQHYLSVQDQTIIAKICHRKFGIGADGLILLERDSEQDFQMIYFNADGRESSMCGNGGRCIVAFAHNLGIIGNTCNFSAIDGLHQAIIQNHTIKLKMKDVDEINTDGDAYVLDTGSPHFVRFVEGALPDDIVNIGRSIRFSESYKEHGININIANKNHNNSLDIATYERGVEDETLSCGTGVTATALAAYVKFGIQSPIHLKSKGGDLKVYFEAQEKGFSNIWLEGKALAVFNGTINTENL